MCNWSIVNKVLLLSAGVLLCFNIQADTEITVKNNAKFSGEIHYTYCVVTEKSGGFVQPIQSRAITPDEHDLKITMPEGGCASAFGEDLKGRTMVVYNKDDGWNYMICPVYKEGQKTLVITSKGKVGSFECEFQ